MSYILAQYPHFREESSGTFFANYITDGVAKRFHQPKNDILSTSEIEIYDECVYIGNTPLVSTNNYYFHGKIQRKLEPQTFLVKLRKVIESSQEGIVEQNKEDAKEQYIKTITINGGNKNSFVDVEFMFNPLETFNCITFELQRTVQDYTGGMRYPKIIYEELSSMNNLIGSRMGISEGVKFIKLGVQSVPGLLMCINSEEIRNSRTGIFEIKNGIMTVSFFCVMNAANETSTRMKDYITELSIDDEEPGAIPWNTEDPYSKCFFSDGKTRAIDGFTVDYMYEQN